MDECIKNKTGGLWRSLRLKNGTKAEKTVSFSTPVASAVQVGLLDDPTAP